MITATQVCDVCGRNFDKRIPAKKPKKKAPTGFITMEFINYCSAKCRRLANLKRGKKSVADKGKDRFNKVMEQMAAAQMRRIETQILGSVAQRPEQEPVKFLVKGSSPFLPSIMDNRSIITGTT